MWNIRKIVSRAKGERRKFRELTSIAIANKCERWERKQQKREEKWEGWKRLKKGSDHHHQEL
jgi:hypothetical protein